MLPRLGLMSVCYTKHPFKCGNSAAPLQLLARLQPLLQSCGVGPAQQAEHAQQARHMAEAIFPEADPASTAPGGAAAADAAGYAGWAAGNSELGAWQTLAVHERRREVRAGVLPGRIGAWNVPS